MGKISRREKHWYYLRSGSVFGGASQDYLELIRRYDNRGNELNFGDKELTVKEGGGL